MSNHLKFLSLIGSLSLFIFFTASGSTVFAANTIAVHGQVGASVTDLHVTLDADTNIVHQDQEIVFTVKYVSLSTASYPAQLRVNWSLGRYTGSPSDNIDVLQYVLGSEVIPDSGITTTYNPLQRTVTWNIPALSSTQGDQVIKFKLKTARDTLLQPATFLVTANMLSNTTTSTDATVHFSYVPNITDLSPQATPTIEKEQTPATVQVEVLIKEISTSQVTLVIKNSLNRGYTVFLGKSPTQLQDTLQLNPVKNDSEFTLDHLQPATTYYLKLVPLDHSQKPLPLITVTTAQQIAESTENIEAVVISQDGQILGSSLGNQVYSEGDPDSKLLVVPAITGYNLDYSIKNTARSLIVSGQIYLQAVPPVDQAGQVLGKTTTQNPTGDLYHKLVTVSSTILSTQLQIPEHVGTYLVLAQLQDKFGNIHQRVFSKILVIKPIQIVELNTQKPVYAAMVYLSRFNENTQLYEAIPYSSTVPLTYRRSRTNGNVIFLPVLGKYKVDVIHPDYKEKSIFFEMTTKAAQNLPVIQLEKKPWNFFSGIRTLFGHLFDQLAQLIDPNVHWGYNVVIK